MSMAREFREFAVKGNVVDLAVGVIIGAAFGKIVSSVVEDLVMPVVGALVGGLDFAGLAIRIGSATVKYGKFVQTCLDFLIIAWAIFLLVKLINRLKREQAPPAPAALPAPPRQEVLLEEIRDLLKESRAGAER
ncbi:MAG: large-conductance mechanosensitive channel protein MscL [Betaproteobacteria bacterium]|nr:MAG: large-conductance mechanosensitive channel protein MscL [Betaproteobacteria bacterium]